MRHIIFSTSDIMEINTIQRLTSWSVHFHDYLPIARCIKKENWFVQLQIPNSLDLKICLIGSFIEAKSYKSTLFLDWKWKPCLSDSRQRKNKLMCLIAWQAAYVIFTVVRSRVEIMASLLKMVITPKGLRTTALYNIFKIAHPSLLHVTEKRLLKETFCGNCLFLMVILHWANEVATCHKK